MSKPFLRTCARTIVLNDGKILLLKNRYRDGGKDGVYWGFPGGCQDALETLEECAIRETKEEANLDVVLVKPVYLEEFIDPAKKHLVELYFFAKPAAGADLGAISNRHDPDDEDRGNKILDVQWVPVAELATLPMRPDRLRDILLKDCQEGFAAGLRMLPAEKN